MKNDYCLIVNKAKSPRFSADIFINYLPAAKVFPLIGGEKYYIFIFVQDEIFKHT